MEERKNNSVVTAVIITVLVMVVLGLIGFIVYDRVINKTDEPKTEENNNVEENNDVIVDYDLDKAKELVDKYYYNWGGIDVTFNNMDENDKMIVAYRKLTKSDFKNANCGFLYANSDKIINQDAGGYYMNVMNNEHVCNEYSETVEYETINSIYNELFVGDMPKKAFGAGFEAIDFIESENKFVTLDFYGGGDWPENIPMYDVLSAKLINDNELIVEVGYTLFMIDAINNVYSPDFDKNIKYNSVDDVEEDFFRKNADKVKVLKFNFVKENDKFVLNNMEA